MLTKGGKCGRINKSPREPEKRLKPTREKEILKKYLTNETEPDIIVTVPLEGRAPCKLNNVRKESTSGASFSRGSRRSCG